MESGAYRDYEAAKPYIQNYEGLKRNQNTYEANFAPSQRATARKCTSRRVESKARVQRPEPKEEKALAELRRAKNTDGNEWMTVAALGLGVAGYAGLKVLHRYRNSPVCGKTGSEISKPDVGSQSKNERHQPRNPGSRDREESTFDRGGQIIEHEPQSRSRQGDQNSDTQPTSRKTLSTHSSSSSSMQGSTAEEKRRVKRAHTKQILTTSLAAVAAVNAADTVYNSISNGKVRRKAIARGDLSEGEAKRLRKRAVIQHIASVGIAAVNIQGAVEIWKDSRELREEVEGWREWRRKDREEKEEHECRRAVQGERENEVR